MVRKLFGAIFVMSVAVGFVMGDEFFAAITKVDGDKITYQKFKKGEKGKKGKGEKDGDPVTIQVAKDAKILKGAGKGKDPEALEGGLKNEFFSKIDDKNTPFARITTDDDNKKVTSIVVFQFGGKKKDDKKDDKKDK